METSLKKIANEKIAPEKIDNTINLIITYQNQDTKTFKCNPNEVLKDKLKKFTEDLKIKFNSVYYLYSGNTLGGDNYNKTLYQIMSNQDKREKTMNILVYDNDFCEIDNQNEININIIFENEPETIREQRDKPLKEIFRAFAMKKGLNLNSLTFKYGDKRIINLDKKFDDIANKLDKKCLGMTISAYSIENMTPVRINFTYNKISKDSIDCYMEDKIRDIFNEYCSRNKLNINNILFFHKNNPVNIENIFHDLNNFEQYESENIILNNSNSTREKNILEIEVLNKNNNNISNNRNNYNPNNYYKPPKNNNVGNRKNYLFIILGIIIVIVIIIIIIIVAIVKKNKSKDKDKDKESDTLKNTYSIDSSDKIKLSDTVKITTLPTEKLTVSCEPGYYIPDDDLTLENCVKCSLDGCVKCQGTYEHNECISCGYLTNIYENEKIIQCFNECEEGTKEKCLKCYKDKNECESCNLGYILINGKCKIDYFIEAVYQTLADGDKIDLVFTKNGVLNMIIDGIEMTEKTKSYQFFEKGNHTVYIKLSQNKVSSLFLRIKNLISVSFTNFNQFIPGLEFNSLFAYCDNLISVDFSKIYYDNFTDSLDFMFRQCYNLRYVNFNIENFIVKETVEKMFYECYSLTSIDLSKFDVSKTTNFENMFGECRALEYIDLDGFKLDKAKTINYMFYNCISLKYLVLSSFKPAVLKTMNYVFYNCHSLLEIELKNFYTSLVTEMSKLFYNCSSLKSLDLSSFNTQNLEYMNSMFENCNSLTSIIFGSSFVTNKVKNINNLFYNCHSLEEINFDITITSTIRSISYVFYNCYSLKRINIYFSQLAIDASLKGLFRGCYSLTSIDLSTGTSKNAMNSFDEIFYDCPNLNYIKFFKINYDSCSDVLFNKNISDNGTLFLSKNYHEFLIKNNIKDNPPSNWIIENY